MSKFELPQIYLDYLNEIGAEVLNFKRAMVKVWHDSARPNGRRSRYYEERVIVNVNDAGEISVSGSGDLSLYQPSDEQQEAIKKAFSKLEFPKAIEATMANYQAMLQKKGINPDNCWPLINQKNGCVRMAQQRVEREGGKQYLPWSYWSDGEWRMMECEVAIPFWKPAKEVSHKIMLHEGAKAAEFAHRLTTSPEMIEKLKAHPWGEELTEFEHWGIIGGALATDRADYSELLARKNISELVMLCDNDALGKEAIRSVSRKYGGLMRGIYILDADDFKVGWDIADPMPAQKFSSKGRWLGHRLLELMFPATWATQTVAGAGNKPAHIISKAFAADWRYCVEPELFINQLQPNHPYKEKEFNGKVRPFSDVVDTAAKLKQLISTQVAALSYQPGEKSGFIFSETGSGQSINTFVPSKVRPRSGDAGPFVRYMEQLIPNEKDRNQLLRWCATLVVRPEIRMHFSVLLTSETQGVGKSTLGDQILAPLVGRSNVSKPNENDIAESNFTGPWAAHKRLAIVDEIYAGQSKKVYNRLKSAVTSEKVTVQKKFVDSYEIDNYLHFFASSNSKHRALKLDNTDRRWFIPEVTEETQTFSYWAGFNAWLTEEGGLEIIRHYLEEFIKEEGAVVLPGEKAPESATKTEMLEEQLSEGQMRVSFMLENLKMHFEDDNWIITDRALRQDLIEKVYGGRIMQWTETLYTIRKTAKSLGFHISKTKIWDKEFGMSYFITPKAELAKSSDPLKQAGVKEAKPQDFLKNLAEKGPNEAGGEVVQFGNIKRITKDETPF